MKNDNCAHHYIDWPEFRLRAYWVKMYGVELSVNFKEGSHPFTGGENSYWPKNKTIFLY